MTDVRPIDANSIHYTRVLAQKGLDMELAAKSSIESMPTLDYAPVRHGEWVKDHSYTRKNHELYYCTVCNHWQKCSIKTPSMNVLHMKYCPSCGAKMDGGARR